MNENIVIKTKYKFKAIFSKRLRHRIKYYGVCPDCRKPNTGYAWCNKCDPGRFLREGKTSGNPEIDKLVYEAQLQTMHYGNNLEWISYDRFQDIKPIGEGGFANIYSATWLDGEPKFGNRRKECTDPITVALKKLKDSKNMNEAFINGIKIHNKCSYANIGITQLYGITKDPRTEEFMIVLQYAKDGNLRDYLKNNFSNLKWREKSSFLYYITYNLYSIHSEAYIHKDLHSGNILQFGTIEAKITDLGLAQLINNSKNINSSNVCGVLPYIAPEVLNGKPYTFASDIYSFGIVMVEVSTGKPPYESVPHDERLALSICNGLRPRVAKGTPQCYIDLVNQCLDANPEKRPSAEELHGKINYWLFMVKEFIDADEIISQVSHSETTTIHSEAIYTSRFMKFTNLSKPINSTRVQIEDPEVSDSQLIELHISGEFHELDQSN